MLSLFIQAFLKLKPCSEVVAKGNNFTISTCESCKASRSCMLSYPSLKCILEHLEVNKRFLLVICCPALRPADKHTPLHIDYLACQFTGTIVNETKYQLGIHRHFPGDLRIPDFFKNINDAGGALYDLDRFGRDDWEPENVLTPGDITTSNTLPIWRNRTGAVWNDYVERSCRRLGELKSLQETPEIRKEKNKLQAAVYAFIFAQLDIPAPYETFLQCTVIEGNDKMRKELMEGTAKMREAMKYLLGKFLGERAFPIRVKHLDMSAEKCPLRLSLGVQFRIKNLITTAHFAHMLSLPIFDPKSFPLQAINIVGDHPFEIEENHEHQVIQNAEMVALHVENTNLDGNWFDIVMKYRSNKHVLLTRCSFSVQQFLMIVDMIIRDQREPGTSYSFGSCELNILEDVIVELSQRPSAKVLTEKR